jgi:hypothetical protein
MALVSHSHIPHKAKSFGQRMSNHAAVALVIFTLMLIFLVTPEMKFGETSIFPYFLLFIFVAALIPFLRRLQYRWDALDNSELSQNGLRTRFLMDVMKIWVAAIGAPFVLMAFFKTILP